MVKYKVKRKEDTPLAGYNHPTKILARHWAFRKKHCLENSPCGDQWFL